MHLKSRYRRRFLFYGLFHWPALSFVQTSSTQTEHKAGISTQSDVHPLVGIEPPARDHKPPGARLHELKKPLRVSYTQSVISAFPTTITARRRAGLVELFCSCTTVPIDFP